VARAEGAARGRSAERRSRAATHARSITSPAASVVPDLDRLIHERVRLGLVSALAAHASLSHNELKALLQTSDGNLSVHARKLGEARYIAIEKRFEGRLPRTEYRLTEKGRRALERYLAHMEAVIRAARGR
jgi:DNA-binding HxlR family transcriptional regulator